MTGHSQEMCASRQVICRTQGRRWNHYRVTFAAGDEPIHVEARVSGRWGARDSYRTIWKSGREMTTTTACAIRTAMAVQS